MRQQGRVAWLGLAVLLVIFLVCGGALVWMYGAIAAIKNSRSIVRMTGSDAKLQAAAKVAQKTLPKFIERLKHPEPGDQFAIKGRFKSPVGPEYLWLKNPELSKDVFKGTLDQQPIAYPVHKGDVLSVKNEDVYDWLIKRADGSMTGGFTENALDPNR